MIALSVDPRSVAQVEDYLAQTKRNIFAKVRTGMKEAMEGLAWTVADKLQGSPIVSRSGELLGHVLASPKVTETQRYIRGSVDAELGNKHLGLWLEEGTHVPATIGTSNAKIYQFTRADGNSFFTHGHRAFQVAPHPFMNPSIEQYQPTILDLIAAKLQEGAVGAV